MMSVFALPGPIDTFSFLMVEPMLKYKAVWIQCCSGRRIFRA